ncbi:MAG: response regulator [Desulfobacteraceae bacterium]|nr:MAG: response regulator [Desulfobacteraceae bacterium]
MPWRRIMNHKILVVDDELSFVALLKEALSREPYQVLGSSSALEALELLASRPVDVVISDEKMPGMTGSEFLALVRTRYPKTIRIILTGHASLEAAIRSINEGEIYRFFTKPCNIFDLAITIRQALQHLELKKENQRLLRMIGRQSDLIRQLERDYPGITVVRRGEKGEVLLDEEGCGLKNLLSRCKASLPKASTPFTG